MDQSRRHRRAGSKIDRAMSSAKKCRCTVARVRLPAALTGIGGDFANRLAREADQRIGVCSEPHTGRDEDDGLAAMTE